MVMQVRVRGVIYRDAKEASAALGVTRNAVYSAINRGDPDAIGLKRRGSINAAIEANKKPIQIAGVHFPIREDERPVHKPTKAFSASPQAVEKALANMLREKLEAIRK